MQTKKKSNFLSGDDLDYNQPLHDVM